MSLRPIMRTFLSLSLSSLLLGALPAQAFTPTEDDSIAAVRASQAVIGKSVSDWRFIDQSGKEVRMSDLRGKPLVVSFMYTGCFQVCPTTTQFLKRAVQSAKDSLGSDSFRVVSIGFNQPFDTPEALTEFATKQGIKHVNWQFLAPRQADVKALLAEFGVSVKATTAGFDHVIQATVVDRDGVIYRQVYGDAFDLPMFMDPIKQLLSGQAEKAISVENIWLKVKLYCTVYDPRSGKYKFNYSIFVELFAGITFLGALLWYLIHGLRSRREPKPVKDDST
ncbi:SCO family protein [Rhodoferax sp.]|uniref:SCO family protein n=1 Tax=Rhodoferax sp. TaxID=50421 RepID=UPI0027649791|nr:SCO family protein [Rhodoferax sp.]